MEWRKNMKKRILALCLAMVMILPLVACGGGSSSEGSGTENSGSSAPAAQPADGGSTAAPVAATGDAALANSLFVNPNVGKGMYPGTAEPNAITVECSTMSVMNTIKMTYNTEFSIARHGWDTLVKLDAENNIVPAAAESWESAPNAAGDADMVWTFHLRPGMKWVDSTGAVIGDVKASDFVFAWKELLNPDNAAEYYAFAAIFKNAQAYYDYKSGKEGAPAVEWEDVAVKAVDDLTIEFELETYLPYLMQYLKFEVLSPVCEELYNKVGADAYGTAPDKMAYSGSFYMSDWVTDNVITMKRNPEWWDAANVSLETIYFAKYSDANTKYNAFAGGEIDIIDITGEQRAMFTAEGFDVISYVGGYSYYFQINTLPDGANDTYPDASKSDMRSKSLRKAISFALDRRQIIDTVFKNDNEPAQCFTLGISGVNTESFGDVVVAANGGSLYPEHADAAKAKEYLAQALTELGYTDPSQINVTLMTSEGSQNELLSQVVQEQIRQVLGFEPKIEVLTITEARARRNKINYDMFMGGWGPDYNDPMTDLDLWMSGNGNNHTGYANPEYDALIESTKTETDPAKREELFVKAEQIIAEDQFIIPVYWRHEDYVASEKIASGAVRRSFQGYFLAYTTLNEG
jgi:oligopeptide transport system substrate-binding protein